MTDGKPRSPVLRRLRLLAVQQRVQAIRWLYLFLGAACVGVGLLGFAADGAWSWVHLAFLAAGSFLLTAWLNVYERPRFWTLTVAIFYTASLAGLFLLDCLLSGWPNSVSQILHWLVQGLMLAWVWSTIPRSAEMKLVEAEPQEWQNLVGRRDLFRR